MCVYIYIYIYIFIYLFIYIGVPPGAPGGPQAGPGPAPGGGPPPRRPRAQMTRGKALRWLGFVAMQSPTGEELRHAYRRAALKWHPDRRQNHGREEFAKLRFQQVRDAYEFLEAELQPWRHFQAGEPPSSSGAGPSRPASDAA